MSREEARKEIASSWVFKPFHPSVVDIYIECALYDAPSGEVRLKMPVVYESSVYVDQYAMAEVFELLQSLDERVELHWVFGSRLTALYVFHLLRRQGFHAAF